MIDKEVTDMFSGFEGKQGELIAILQDFQEKDGYISEETVERVSRFLKISKSKIFGVASFYSQFRFSEPGRHSIKICLGTACHVAGGHVLGQAIQRELDVSPGETTENGRFDYERAACLGCCALAPVVKVGDDIHSRVTVNSLNEILEKYE
jgi:NADH-quinone oxidoreductase subunit E